MSYFILPMINSTLSDKMFKFRFTDEEYPVTSFISHSLCCYLTNVKKNIDQYQTQWDHVKKYTNPYEYIHTPIPNNKSAICKYKPISRSFFKMVEITGLLYLLENYHDKTMKSFHLAEGPGGFIEAIALLRKNPDDIYYGMTLLSSDEGIPGWRKSADLLEKHKNIVIENGADNTGNLYSTCNLQYCYDKYNNSMDLITGDGGFDFSIDFNKQEVMSSRLIFSQICFAVIMQKQGGNFILKIFDIFTEFTVDIIFLLSCLYDKVYIVKPCTSRAANSEKYLVCKNFRLSNSKNLLMNFLQVFSDIDKCGDSFITITKIMNLPIPYYFLNKLEEFNSIIGQYQIGNISSTINLIENRNRKDKIENIKKNNIHKCINWCVKYKIPFYKNLAQTNIFLHSQNSEDDNYEKNPKGYFLT